MRKKFVMTVLAVMGLASFWWLLAAVNPAGDTEKPGAGLQFNLEQIRNPGQFNIDHFKVYEIENQPADIWIRLRGQFDVDLIPTHLNRYAKFLNPVDKNGEGIINKFNHLNWYLFDPQPEPVRTVTFWNQFGLQTIKIGQAVALLAPAEKVEPGSQPPSHLDHFKLYEVISAQPVNIPVTLKDQFVFEDNRAIIARYFAVPVEKLHENQFFPIENPDDHLVFYVLDPRDLVESRPTVDQFGDHPMTTRFSEQLGVPTKKIAWQ